MARDEVPSNSSLPMLIGIPSTGRLSLTAIGTPANGRGSPMPISACRGERRLVGYVGERIHLWLQRIDAPQRLLHQLARR